MKHRIEEEQGYRVTFNQLVRNPTTKGQKDSTLGLRCSDQRKMISVGEKIFGPSLPLFARPLMTLAAATTGSMYSREDFSTPKYFYM